MYGIPLNNMNLKGIVHEYSVIIRTLMSFQTHRFLFILKTQMKIF